MFDFHMHSTVSFDGHDSPEEMAGMAAGLREICFTDHIDYQEGAAVQTMVFDPESYRKAYGNLAVPGLTIRRGMEFGLTPDNPYRLAEISRWYPFDFVLGSVHFVAGEDVYFGDYWQGKDVDWVYRRYLEETLACVEVHTDFDVLGHLTYICKCRGNPTHAPLEYRRYRDLVDEILRRLVEKGKGLELNTSGVDRCGDFLPSREILQRFRELGGEIVTIGSDAHTSDRVGQYADRACGLLKEIFGHVCTFRERNPVFHKL